MSDELSKWIGIGSGITTVILAVPALASMNPWLLAGSVTGLVIVGTSAYLHFRPQPYDVEFISHDVELDIRDPMGHIVIQTRRTRIRATRNNVETVTDHMSADGSANIPTVDPGIVKNVRREGGDLFVTSALGRVLRKGEEIDRTLTTTLTDSFAGSSEYWSVRIHHPMQRFTLTVKFPPERRPLTFRGMQRESTYEHLAETQPQLTVGAGGAWIIRWAVTSPTLKDVYKLEWNW